MTIIDELIWRMPLTNRPMKKVWIKVNLKAQTIFFILRCWPNWRQHAYWGGGGSPIWFAFYDFETNLQLAGHRPVIIIGGAPVRLADPSGKSEERVLTNDGTMSR